MADKMLTPSDIRGLVGNVRLVKFDTLIGYETIEELLPKEKDCVIIFWEIESENVGHYTALCRLNKAYIFFDSYGHTEQEDFSYIPMTLRRQLDIKYDYLKELLKGKHVISNHVAFQKMKNGVNTCGRFVAMFLYVFKRGYSLADFQKLMKENLRKGGFKNYDEMAVDFT
jgi:hypothetical protein